MPRPFFGSGFFPPDTPPPEVYTALVAAFGGDEAAADAWLDDWIAYAGDGATMQDLLAALEDVGAPADAIAVLRAAPVRRAMDFAAELDQPVPGLAYSAPAVPLAGMPGRATDL